MIAIGLLTSPLPFLAVGVAAGALSVIVAATVISNRKTGARVASWLDAQRRETAALRDIIAAVDRCDRPERIRQIATTALYPATLAMDDEPIIPEVSHG